jgi:hypothetical protein
MKSLTVIAVLLATLFLSCSSKKTLIADGKSEYKIFVSQSAPQPEKYAATELQKYLKAISGVQLDITNSDPTGKVIFVGAEGAPEEVAMRLNLAKFANEEYVITTSGENLVIAGGGTRGTLYGVLGFLSDHLGCRWYTRSVTKIPEMKVVEIPEMDDHQKPSFEYREAWYREAYDTQWALHNRLNPSMKPIPDSLGGSYITFPFVHTFYELLPPKEHFAKHPEYYSLVGGKRVGEKGQLCLTNPDVVRLSTAKVFSWIKEHPNANVFSVDQNDYSGGCECEHCQRIDKKEGSPSGSVITFVNQIADSVGKVYPDIKLQTLAYDYTEVPPKTIRPADNVTIRLCHYVYCSAHPIEGCDNHKQYRDRLTQWKKIAKRITIWDYFTDFSQYLLPYPNFETLKHDVKYYADNGIIGLFAQGNNVKANGGGEFSELRAWVFSQLMWNANRDGQELIEEFTKNVYGDAAPFIDEYISMLHKQVKADSVFFSIWSQPTEMNYLNVPTLQKADSLFALAAKATAGDTALAARVELAYLPVLYTKLYFYSIGGTALLSREEMPAAMQRFRKVIEKHQIRAIGDVEETYGNLQAFIEKVEATGKFYTDWTVIGPFDNEKVKGLLTPYEPEKVFDPAKSYPGKQGEVKWFEIHDNSTGYVDFSKIFTPGENVVSYARTTIVADKAGVREFGVGSNDGIRVWMNGKLVLDRPVSRRAEPNQDKISVPVKAGENTVLVKVDQLKRGWGFYFSESMQGK